MVWRPSRTASMETFTQELIAISARISRDAAAACRGCLCAIVEQLQQQPEAERWSLQDWWQWLDEEGYDRQSLGLTLRHLCEASLEEPNRSALQASFEAIRSGLSGIARLNEEIEALAPPLMARIEALTAQAIEEDQALKSTGAGLSKGGWIGVGLGGAGLGIGIFAIARRRAKKRAMEGALNLEHNLHNGITRERAAERYIHRESIKVEARVVATENRAKEEAGRVERYDKREFERIAHNRSTREDFKAYSKAINDKFKSHVSSDDFRLKPLFVDNKGVEHYILQYHERDMVKAVVKGQEFIFYKSTGKAGKAWATQQWYPVSGIGKDGWINKFDGAQNHFGARELKQVNSKLLDLSQRKSFKDTEREFLQAETEDVRVQLNKDMGDVIEYHATPERRLALKRDMLKRVFPMIIEERFPKVAMDVDGLMKKISEKPYFGSWFMRGITEDPYELRIDLENQIEKETKDIISEANKIGEEISPEYLEKYVLYRKMDFYRQFPHGSRIQDALKRAQQKAEDDVVAKARSAATNQISDRTAQLEARATDAAEQEMKMVVDNRVVAAADNEEKRLITRAEGSAKGLVREGEQAAAQEAINVEDAALRDVRMAENGGKAAL